MTKHTPGPWHATQDVMGRWHVDADYRGPESDYIPVADIRNDAIANARLMAAAPELLEAAKKGLGEAESWIHNQLDGTSDLDSILAQLEPIRKAIAKAEGGGK